MLTINQNILLSCDNKLFANCMLLENMSDWDLSLRSSIYCWCFYHLLTTDYSSSYHILLPHLGDPSPPSDIWAIVKKWKLLATHCMISHGSECEAGSNELSVTIHHSQCNEGQIIGPMYSIRRDQTTTTKTMTAKATTRCSTHHENKNFLEQVTHRDVFKFSLRCSIIKR